MNTDRVARLDDPRVSADLDTGVVNLWGWDRIEREPFPVALLTADEAEQLADGVEAAGGPALVTVDDSTWGVPGPAAGRLVGHLRSMAEAVKNHDPGAPGTARVSVEHPGL